MEAVRLNKFLSEAGVCSRRQADELIAAGKILVDGVPAATGMKVTDSNEVCYQGKRVLRQEKPVLLAVNKPRGIVCTTARVERDNIVNFVNYPTRVYPVGRLDKDSEGLILMTNQGDMVNRLLRGSNNHEKEYVVTIDRPITEGFLRAMRQGVPILDTMTKPCQVEPLGKYKFRIILTQGLNRQIRRMCEFLGMRVVHLKRVRVLNINLGNLPLGEYREITGEEYKRFMALLEGSSSLSYKDRKLKET